MNWATMRGYILETLLKEDVTEAAEDQRYTPVALAVYARWALAELALHTAAADSVVYPGDGMRNTFRLPANLVDSVERSGLLAYETVSGITYIPPYKRLPGMTWPIQTNQNNPVLCYWEWPSGMLTLGFFPSATERVVLNYFRIWKSPEDDADELEIPQWMEQPFAYLVAAAAMEPIGAQAASIRQWNRKQDSGNPEHNPAQKQAAWFVQQAYRLLARVAPQNRETFYWVDDLRAT
jgi:hypothetical protein